MDDGKLGWGEGGIKDPGRGPWYLGSGSGGDVEGRKESWSLCASVLIPHQLFGAVLSALVIQEKLIQLTRAFKRIKFFIKFLNNYYLSSKKRKFSGVI